MPEECLMLIASPAILDERLRRIPQGQTFSVKMLRSELAAVYQAEHTCPVTTGILLQSGVKLSRSADEFQGDAHVDFRADKG